MIGRAQAANQGRDAALQLAGGPIGGMLLAAGGWLIGAAMVLGSLVSAVAAWLLGRRVGWARAGGGGGDADAAASALPALPGNALRELREGVRWLSGGPT